MTVAEIKEYIDRQRTRLEKIEVNLSNRDMRTMLSEIKYMLDQLEQPIEIDTKKYFEQINKLVDKEMAQKLKDHMKKALKKEIEKGVKVDDTTSNSDRNNRR